MQPTDEVRLKIPGATIAAKVWGPEDGHPVLALHGWLDNAATMDPLAPLLERIRLVALDLPGHGLSEHRPAETPYHFIDYVADVAMAADALGWERFTLMGHSMGSAIALLLAGTLPERITGLILLEGTGPLTTPAEKTPEQLATAITSQNRVIGRTPRVYADFSQAVRARRTATSPISEAAAATLVTRGTRAVPGGYTFRFDPRLRENSRLRLTEPQVHAFISRIACPTLIVLADQGWHFPKPIIDQRLSRFANLAQITVPGGHHVHMDNPERVAPAVQSFIDRQRHK